jgi:hypothetical protein
VSSGEASVIPWEESQREEGERERERERETGSVSQGARDFGYS